MDHVVVNGRLMRRVSLDSDPLVEQGEDEQSLDRLMRRRPTPAFDRRGVLTRNGNVIVPVAR